MQRCLGVWPPRSISRLSLSGLLTTPPPSSPCRIAACFARPYAGLSPISTGLGSDTPRGSFCCWWHQREPHGIGVRTIQQCTNTGSPQNCWHMYVCNHVVTRGPCNDNSSPPLYAPSRSN